MRYFIFITFLWFSCAAYSQEIPTFHLLPEYEETYWQHVKRNAPVWGLVLGAGMSNGISDAIQHKYNATLFARNPNNAKFWNPNTSWRNKWKNGDWRQGERFPLSSTALAFTTDGWHMTKTIQLKQLQIAIPLYKSGQYSRRKKWWWGVADVAIASLAFSTGWHISESIIVRQ